MSAAPNRAKTQDQPEKTPYPTNPFDEETLETLQFLKEHPVTAPILKEHDISIAIVLGTGLGPFVDGLKGKVSVSYDEIPHMPKCTIKGHSGNIVIGYFDSAEENPSTTTSSSESNRLYCIVYSGRVHAYEGISYHDVCFQVKLSAALGCQRYILTNSTGGLQDGMYNGCLFLIQDHIRFIGRTDPLFEMRYASQWKVKDTQKYWDEDFQQIARKCADRLDIELFQGNYVYSSGPTYETPLEVQTAIKAGGGVVGMSTVAEVIAANSYGMKVLGISMVTNLGAGISTKMLTHDEVQENAAQAIPRFIDLLQEIVREVNATKTDETDHESSGNDAAPPTSKQNNSPLERQWEMHEKRLEKKNLNAKNLRASIPEALKYIEENLGITADELSSVLFIASDETLAESIKDAKSVNLRDIPHFPYVSIAGNFGTMYYGVLDTFADKDSSKKTLLIRTRNREGFNEEEAAFISLLAWRLGMQELVHTVQGQHIEKELSGTATEKEVQYPPFTVVDDFLNFSASTRPLSIMRSIMDGRFLDAAQCNPLAEPHDSNPKEKQVYLSFQSPSTASVPEEHMGRLYGATMIGRTNLSPLYAFRYLGMKVTAIRTSTDSKQKREYVDHMHKYVAQEAECKQVLATEGRDSLPLYKEPLPISSSNTQTGSLIIYEDVCEAAQYVQKQLLVSASEEDEDIVCKHAILDLDLKLEWPKELIVKSIPLRKIPHIATNFPSNSLRALNLDLLMFGTGEDATYCLSVSGCFDSYEPFYVADGSFFVRLFQQLGIREIILTSSLRAASADATADAVYVLKDHVNFTGENPLIGRNIPQWGPRFPDATTVYSLPFEAPEDVEVRKVNCLFTSTNRLLRLRAEEDMARSLDCEVLGNLAIREMLTSTHCKDKARIQVGLLGLLENYEPGSKVVNALQQMIYKFFERESKE